MCGGCVLLPHTLLDLANILFIIHFHTQTCLPFLHVIFLGFYNIKNFLGSVRQVQTKEFEESCTTLSLVFKIEWVCITRSNVLSFKPGAGTSYVNITHFFWALFCNCLSYFTTAKISFTSTSKFEPFVSFPIFKKTPYLFWTTQE